MHYPSYIKSKVKHTLPAFPFHSPSPVTETLGRGWFTPFELYYSCNGEYVFTAVLPNLNH